MTLNRTGRSRINGDAVTSAIALCHTAPWLIQNTGVQCDQDRRVKMSRQATGKFSPNIRFDPRLKAQVAGMLIRSEPSLNFQAEA